MSAKTGIEWTDATWNPIVGCSIVSPACTNCYAMAQAARVEKMHRASMLKELPDECYLPEHHYDGLTQPSKAGPVWTGKVARAPEHILTKPLHWKRPRRIFVNSMSDLFHESVPDEWIDRIFAVMALCAKPKPDERNVIVGYEAHHIFQVLTKRSARMRKYMTELNATLDTKGAFLDHRLSAAARSVSKSLGHPFWMNAPFSIWGWISNGFPGLWLGVTAEDQTRADERCDDLEATPAAKRFVSYEPALGPLDLRRWLKLTPDDKPLFFNPPRDHLDWVICGGESGPNARPMHPDWARSLRDQCAAAGVPFFFKQWGEFLPVGQNLPGFGKVHGGTEVKPGRMKLHYGGPPKHAFAECGVERAAMEDGRLTFRVGKHRAGSLLDGREHKEFPA